MKFWLAVLGLLVGMPGWAAQRLKTESFDVTIEVRCAEGVVGCPDVQYTGVHRESGRSIRLAGRELHTRCADGVTPCRFLGYGFRNGTTYYVVFDDGTLVVKQGDKVLVQERGEWQ